MGTANGKGAENSLKQLIESFVSVIEDKDPFMKQHAERVATTCVRLSRKLGLSQQEVNQIYLAGLLHDIGIVYIPQQITQKGEDLTDEEIEMVKKHPLISERIVSKHSILNGLLPAIRHHHEAVDGSGYPDGLKGNQIPMGAKILGLVNYFDSMTTPRANRPSMSREKAVWEIKNKAGQQFDEGLVDYFIEFIQQADNSGSDKKDKEMNRNSSGVESRDKGTKEEPGTVKEVIHNIIIKFKSGGIELPLLPNVVNELQKEMSKPATTVSSIAAVIERDAVISFRLIAVANSPMFRGTERIVTIKQAIPRLGVKETQTIVNSIANKSLYTAKGNSFKHIMEKLWLHSLASAYAARAIATKTFPGDAEKLYFMGLIHDIGKVLLLKAFGDISNTSLDHDDIMAAIQETHTSFGGAILRKWGFSEGFARISLLHEGPDFRPDTDKEILAVNIASSIADMAGYGLNEEEIAGYNPVAAKLLDLDSEIIDKVNEDIRKQMEDTSNIF